VNVRGAGPLVVLLHPVGLDGGVWEPIAAGLAVHHTVLAPDLRGHGKAAAPAGPWTIADLAADVRDLVEEVDLGSADVVGLSLGGMVAQQLALDHPESVRSLVLVATTGGFDEAARETIRGRGRRALEDGMDAVVDETIERWFGQRARDREPALGVRRRLLANDPRAWAASWDAMAAFDVRERLGELAVPVLVIGGEEDESTPPPVCIELVEAIPDASLRIVRGAGHLAALERPDAYRPLIEGFLGRSAVSGRTP
jgi:3-oxoadipate enol-lactonase